MAKVLEDADSKKNRAGRYECCVGSSFVVVAVVNFHFQKLGQGLVEDH